MKLVSVIRKSFKEQTRHFWILILTISMAPFFVSIYYLINEVSKPHYELLVLNQDKGIELAAKKLNYGSLMFAEMKQAQTDASETRFIASTVRNKAGGVKELETRKADALVIIPRDFSAKVQGLVNGKDIEKIDIKFIGDLTNTEYMVTAVYANGIIDEFMSQAAHIQRPVRITETGLGASGKIDDFDLYVPGILVLSVIMLMFSAAIAIVREVENKTILRLKLSRISALEFLSGVSLIQVLVGIVSVSLTLAVAVLLGFDFAHSFGIFGFLVVLTSISIIAFSLIIAGITKTVNDVLIVGNFPLFLFMFFSGAAFPIKGRTLFTVAGYPITIQGLMSPTHSISALNKVLIMNKGWGDIWPEIAMLVALTIIYFAVGVGIFQYRHMRVE